MKKILSALSKLWNGFLDLMRLPNDDEEEFDLIYEDLINESQKAEDQHGE